MKKSWKHAAGCAQQNGFVPNIFVQHDAEARKRQSKA
jgi:hypothetical protein